MSKYPAIRRAIMEGEVDEFLEEIQMCLTNRVKTAAKQRSYQLEPGDFIELPRNTKPRMLAGQIVIYEGQDASKLRVRLTSTYSPKWLKGSIIKIPATMVGKVVKHRDARKGEVSDKS